MMKRSLGPPPHCWFWRWTTRSCGPASQRVLRLHADEDVVLALEGAGRLSLELLTSSGLSTRRVVLEVVVDLPADIDVLPEARRDNLLDHRILLYAEHVEVAEQGGHHLARDHAVRQVLSGPAYASSPQQLPRSAGDEHLGMVDHRIVE